jgi:hypothetical protein
MRKRAWVCAGIMFVFLGTGVAWGQTGNTFYGTGAGSSITTGSHDTFVGYSAGNSTDTGNYNTFVGHGAGEANTLGSWNTFLGKAAGRLNYSGNTNTFVGSHAGFSNTAGESNAFFGYGAGYTNTAAENTFLGAYAGYSNNGGGSNTFVGKDAGYKNVTGYANTFVGREAGYENTGTWNTFVGYQAGPANTSGQYNTFLGADAGQSNTIGSENTFLGAYAGATNTGSGNTFVGRHAGGDNEGTRSVFIGYQAGYHEQGSEKLYVENSDAATPLIYGEFDNRILSLDGKVGVNVYPLYRFDVSSDGEAKSSMHFSMAGADVGGWITSVSENNFFLSSGAMYDSAEGGWIQKSSDGKSVYAGSGGSGYAIYVQDGGTVGEQVTNRLRFRIDYNGNVGIGTASPSHPLHLGNAHGAYCSAGGVWTNASSRDAKENIAELTSEQALATLKELSPVTFTYKGSHEEAHVGFIAEDVPALVASPDRKGLSPMDIVAVLTKAMQEQQKVIEELKGEIQNLKSEMREQVAKGPGRTIARTLMEE